MELTLLPLAAILLLLSGLSAPARAAGRQAADRALMHAMFGGGRRQGAPVPGEARLLPCRHLAHYSCAERLDVPAPAGAANPMQTRPLFQTRFGHARGAYRATAPPRG